MPLHKDFRKIKKNFIEKYGKKLGTEYFYRWLNAHKYDDTKPFPGKKSAMEEFELLQMEIMHKTLQLDSLYMDNKPHNFVLQDHWAGEIVHVHHWWEKVPGGDIIDGMVIRPVHHKPQAPPVVMMETKDKLLDAVVLSNEPSVNSIHAGPLISESIASLSLEGVSDSGVILTRDSGVQYYGVQTPHFKEFFLTGKRYTGRWVYMQTGDKWTVSKPLDQMPYVLSGKAELELWVPPWQVSCLPPSILESVPEKYKYWERLNRAQRLTICSELRRVGLRPQKS